MSNFPDGNPFTYLYVQPGSQFLFDLAVLRPYDSMRFLVRAADQKLADAELEFGCEIPGAAFMLNSNLQGKTVLVYGQEHIDRVDEIFSKAGTERLFTLEEMTDGWVQDMIDSFKGLEVEQGKRAVTSVQRAEAVRSAHEGMIPF
ncbi:hypothetical protein CWC48_30060 [Pseudomonas sp. S10E 269]|uniref:hypothetical protein n=1 Tax=Pseudomonas sp. S10E 269 TaxID=2054917 RepID=UPI000C25D3D2|nr:hypothetical protein [Pseudomonas sp. S10E 269]PJK37576.1 hypothetical protein CWC48_30060 [Pseudomonas sp. S10E 269]